MISIHPDTHQHAPLPNSPQYGEKNTSDDSYFSYLCICSSLKLRGCLRLSSENWAFVFKICSTTTSTFSTLKWEFRSYTISYIFLYTAFVQYLHQVTFKYQTQNYSIQLSDWLNIFPFVHRQLPKWIQLT